MGNAHTAEKQAPALDQGVCVVAKADPHALPLSCARMPFADDEVFGGRDLDVVRGAFDHLDLLAQVLDEGRVVVAAELLPHAFPVGLCDEVILECLGGLDVPEGIPFQGLHDEPFLRDDLDRVPAGMAGIMASNISMRDIDFSMKAGETKGRAAS